MQYLLLFLRLVLAVNAMAPPESPILKTTTPGNRLFVNNVSSLPSSQNGITTMAITRPINLAKSQVVEINYSSQRPLNTEDSYGFVDSKQKTEFQNDANGLSIHGFTSEIRTSTAATEKVMESKSKISTVSNLPLPKSEVNSAIPQIHSSNVPNAEENVGIADNERRELEKNDGSKNFPTDLSKKMQLTLNTLPKVVTEKQNYVLSGNVDKKPSITTTTLAYTDGLFPQYVSSKEKEANEGAVASSQKLRPDFAKNSNSAESFDSKNFVPELSTVVNAEAEIVDSREAMKEKNGQQSRAESGESNVSPNVYKIYGEANPEKADEILLDNTLQSVKVNHSADLRQLEQPIEDKTNPFDSSQFEIVEKIHTPESLESQTVSSLENTKNDDEVIRLSKKTQESISKTKETTTANESQNNIVETTTKSAVSEMTTGPVMVNFAVMNFTNNSDDLSAEDESELLKSNLVTADPLVQTVSNEPWVDTTELKPATFFHEKKVLANDSKKVDVDSLEEQEDGSTFSLELSTLAPLETSEPSLNDEKNKDSETFIVANVTNESVKENMTNDNGATLRSTLANKGKEEATSSEKSVANFHVTVKNMSNSQDNSSDSRIEKNSVTPTLPLITTTEALNTPLANLKKKEKEINTTSANSKETNETMKSGAKLSILKTANTTVSSIVTQTEPAIAVEKRTNLNVSSKQVEGTVKTPNSSSKVYKSNQKNDVSNFGNVKKHDVGSKQIEKAFSEEAKAVTAPSVTRRRVFSTLPLKTVRGSTRREWRPFHMDCNAEEDEKGDLCFDWARAGLCLKHRPTMFLFCRKTCLCTGPPDF